MKNPSIFGSSQKRGVLIPICSRFESVTFRESEAILTLPEVCQQSEPARKAGCFRSAEATIGPVLPVPVAALPEVRPCPPCPPPRRAGSRFH
ncbi:hypothetical protein B3286c1_1986 [Brucella vulpis]|uniref:hypothetical protein n=1 Tax=Brucella vulpis TaxID=981386 RepID=UPI00073A8864|nr:hypothetical protein BF3285c1_1987 [Brucella vulpis]CUW50785.1 hypothetical protein B3286c1_1986 [Brucella vulpis]